ncbi:sensor histidine kinase [Streptomyces orinoci]|uniref:histidine kinase n=1 Tax=Streptomyces orinoci TaxID=67339 RepID=A0ABV3JTG6_STRON|nr:sensor histidine kinase [Streptomyces orinoci]
MLDALRRTLTAGPPDPLLGSAKRPFVRKLPYVVALILIAALLPSSARLMVRDYRLDTGLALVLAVGQAGPLLLAVRRPLPAWGISFAAGFLGAWFTRQMSLPPDNPWPWSAPVTIELVILMLALGLRERPRVLVLVWLLMTAGTVMFQTGVHPPGNGSSAVVLVLGGLLMAMGVALRDRARARRALAEQETISEAERAQRTLLEERARIARELHDVVAHHMSVITVQADSAPYRIAGLPPQASEEFGAIAATARESLGEMRRLLGVLRSDGRGSSAAERAPQPGLDRIQQLVEATVRSGLPVELSLAAEALAADLPQAVDLSAYRIVQEALANVVRHAPGALTRVSVTTDGSGLTILVVNQPADRPHAPLETSGTGHGLVGMRERVRLVGGTLDTGPLPDGGFRVAARLPLGEDAGAGSGTDGSASTPPTEKDSPAA